MQVIKFVFLDEDAKHKFPHLNVVNFNKIKIFQINSKFFVLQLFITSYAFLKPVYNNIVLPWVWKN